MKFYFDIIIEFIFENNDIFKIFNNNKIIELKNEFKCKTHLL